jgi:hypothetical protein
VSPAHHISRTASAPRPSGRPGRKEGSRRQRACQLHSNPLPKRRSWPALRLFFRMYWLRIFRIPQRSNSGWSDWPTSRKPQFFGVSGDFSFCNIIAFQLCCSHVCSSDPLVPALRMAHHVSPESLLEVSARRTPKSGDYLRTRSQLTLLRCPRSVASRTSP